VTNHFYVIDPQGVAHTRSSKNRTYTHTVLIFRGPAMEAAALARAQRSTLADSIKTHATYISWSQCVDLGSRPRPIVAGDYLNQRGLEHVAKFASAEAYEASQLAWRLQCHAKDVAKGQYSKWHNAGWCGRPDLAVKLAAQETVTTKILEAQVGKPPKATKQQEAA
jgi:hypothetical protein